AERPPEKRKVTGSTPVPTTRMTRPKRLVIVHFRDGAGATAGPGSRPGPRRLTSSSFGVAQDRTSFTPLDPAPNEPTPIERRDRLRGHLPFGRSAMRRAATAASPSVRPSKDARSGGRRSPPPIEDERRW